MGINVRVQDAPKPDGIIAAQVNMEKDLKDCMRCRFFYGNNSQCLSRKCVREKGKWAAEYDGTIYGGCVVNCDVQNKLYQKHFNDMNISQTDFY